MRAVIELTYGIGSTTKIVKTCGSLGYTNLSATAIFSLEPLDSLLVYFWKSGVIPYLVGVLLEGMLHNL